MERNHHYTGALFMKWTAAGGLLALLLGVAGCARDRGVQAAEGQKAHPVKTEAAQVRDVRRQVDVIGTLAAREEVVVSAEVAGRAAALRHSPGRRGRPGAARPSVAARKSSSPAPRA